jgi:hypothetical protein
VIHRKQSFDGGIEMNIEEYQWHKLYTVIDCKRCSGKVNG